MKSKFTFTTELNNEIEREVLLTLPNPSYDEIISKCNYLGGIQMHDTNTKNLLPIYTILGANNFEKLKMGTCPRVVQIGEPFVE